MRIVTWNCCRGPLAKKLAALDSLKADVVVLTEAPPPEPNTDRVLWFPSGVSKLGVQVRAGDAYRLAELPRADLPNCVSPVRVTGAKQFNLLAVWTWPAPSYIKAFNAGVDAYAPLLQTGHTVIAGDFNGNPGFDKPRSHLKWGDAFAKLEQHGLVSAYHHSQKASYGHEPQPTHHFLRKQDRKFHIDFCFLPKIWTEHGFRAHIPHGAPWESISDHFPIIVDIE